MITISVILITTQKWDYNIIALFLILEGIYVLLSIVTTPFWIPINSMQRFQFLYNLTNTCQLLIIIFFNNSQLTGVRWYFIIVLINSFSNIQKSQPLREFPGDLVVKTWHFPCLGLGSIPVWGTKTLKSVLCGQKLKKQKTLLRNPQFLLNCRVQFFYFCLKISRILRI